MPVQTIRIIKASSPDREGYLPARIQELEAAGFEILFDDLIAESTWPYCAASVQDRAKALTHALLEDQSDAVMWARGGYGASELLPLIPWDKVQAVKPKPIIGFSDTVAAQSALYNLTKRTSLHGPMPATVTWKQNGTSDVDTMISYLKGELHTSGFAVSAQNFAEAVEGTLFGGCLAVLTSLIGTPYLPKSFAGHILLFEDIGENPGRVVRCLNQWQQAGLFAGVSAVVFGAFIQLGGNLPDNSPVLFEELRRRFAVPIFTTAAFGHLSPNAPFETGAKAVINNGRLTWTPTYNSDLNRLT